MLVLCNALSQRLVFPFKVVVRTRLPIVLYKHMLLRNTYSTMLLTVRISVLVIQSSCCEAISSMYILLKHTFFSYQTNVGRCR